MADILDGGWGCVGGYIFYRGPPNDSCTQVFLYDFGEEIWNVMTNGSKSLHDLCSDELKSM